MSSLSKLSVPVASDKKSRFALPSDHVTTSSFMTLQPVMYQHIVKGSKISVNMLSNVRPAPMAVPTYGRIRQNIRAFFVPYRQVFLHYDAFMTDVIASGNSTSARVTSVPSIAWDEIVKFFIDPQIASVVTAPASYDFMYSGVLYKLTRFGRWCYKVFYSLGYDIVPSSKDVKFNALALLAFAKLYCDWYVPTQYRDSATYLAVSQMFNNNDVIPLSLLSSDLLAIFQLCSFVSYDSNGYFDFAWDNPVSPVSSQNTPMSFQDISSTLGNATVTTDTIGTPVMQQQYGSTLSIGTQYLHDALKKLTDYQHRHALVGASAIDRFLAEAGFVSDYLKLQRSIYLGNKSVDVNVGDIYATADSTDGQSTSKVGDYAGKGFGADQHNLEFTCDEDGIVIVVSSIMPSGGYYQGYDRCNRRLTKDEFFNADFDSLSVQAIEKGEVYVSKDLDNFGSAADYKIPFGYTGRYGELKKSINRVSGDVALPSVMVGGNSWHLMRQFSDFYFNYTIANVSHSEAFLLGGDAFQYNRIFNYTGDEIDPFYVFMHFDVNLLAPMRSLFDTYDFDSDAQQIDFGVGAKLN